MAEINKIYFSTKEVAEALGCSESWVHRLANKIRIPYKGNRRRRKFTDYDIMKLSNHKNNL